MGEGGPTYDLNEIKHRVAGGAFVITLQARRDAYDLGFDVKDMRDCVLELSTSDFHKSMRSRRFPGRYQDVYRPVYAGFGLYVKIQMLSNGPVVIVSFKLR